MGIEFKFAEELLLKSGHRLLVVNPPKNLPLPPSITIFNKTSFNQIPKESLHAILIFIKEYTYFLPFLKQYQKLLKLTGHLWVGYPRIQSAMSEIDRVILVDKLSFSFILVKRFSFEGTWNILGFNKIQK